MVDEGYPDVERALIGYLSEQVAEAGDQTPPDLSRPFVRVQRVGGADDGLTDRVRIEVATYAPTRVESQALAEHARQLITACESTSAAGIFVDNVINEAHTGRTAYDNYDVRRISSTYRLSVRRPRD